MVTERRKSCGETSGICWREPASVLPESALDFCQETSLHGVKYICQPKRHLCERIFWLLTLISGGVTAGLLIGKLWMEYLHQPIIVFSPYETTIDQIPFPAVTICNSNLLRRSGLEKLINITERFLATENESEIAGSGYQIGDLTDVYLARYICNNQSTFGQKVNFTLARDKRNMQDILVQLEDVCVGLNAHNTTEKVYNFFGYNIPHKCDDMIKKCQLNDDVVSCTTYFMEEFVVRQGCCTFNLIPDKILNRTKSKWMQDSKTLNPTTFQNMTNDDKSLLYWFNDLKSKDGLLLSTRAEGVNAVHPGNFSEKQNWYTPRRQRNSGKSGGLSILIDPELFEYTCGLTDSEGVLLQVHPLTNTPNAKDMGMLIKPNTEVFLEVTPKVTVANENLKDIPIKYRNCYFQNEKYLLTSWFYTLDLCIDECIYNLTQKECNCDLTRKTYSNSIYCELEGFICAQERIKLRTRNEFAAECQCLPLCTTVEYTTRMSTSIIDIGRKVKGGSNTGDDVNESTVSTNQLSIIHIYFVDEYVYARERKKMYGWVDLVANAGGVLGLCLGFSALSLLECVYFLTVRNWCHNRRRKTILNVITGNMTRLIERKREEENIPENRRIRFAINQLHEEAMQNMLTINNFSLEETESL